MLTNRTQTDSGKKNNFFFKELKEISHYKLIQFMMTNKRLNFQYKNIKK